MKTSKPLNNVQILRSFSLDYEGFYKCYDQEWRAICAVDKANNLAEFIELIVAEFGEEGISILDFGAGDGSVLEQLAKRNSENKFCAAEFSSHAVSILSRNNSVVEAFNVGNETVDHIDDRFDLLIASHVLEHVIDIDRFLKNISSLSGKFLIEVPLEDNGFLGGNLLENDTGHVNFYNPNTIKLLLESRNFKIRKEKIYLPSLDVHRFKRPFWGFFTWGVKKLLVTLFPRLVPFFLCFHMIIYAEKCLHECDYP